MVGLVEVKGLFLAWLEYLVECGNSNTDEGYTTFEKEEGQLRELSCT
jgi:hypothetical protein